MLPVEELIPICGYPRGAIGPVALRCSVSHILIDEALLTDPSTGKGDAILLCGAGEPGVHFKTSAVELLRKLPEAVIVDIHSE